MFAAIDVGSNTLRMLIGQCTDSGIRAASYHHLITRLGGDYSPAKGLASQSMERTLSAFTAFSQLLQNHPEVHVRAVGTAALRRAKNSPHFIAMVKARTGLTIEIINGAEEARLTCTGVLSVLNQSPAALIVDIGGGSTEFVFYADQKIWFSQSYPVGVVRLCEETTGDAARQHKIQHLLKQLLTDLQSTGISKAQLKNCQLVGTAGTITSLAAMNLNLLEYDRLRVNNHLLDVAWLTKTHTYLQQLSVARREQLPGMELGRGDLIIPGLELIIGLCRHLDKQLIQAADAGVLEGILLDFCLD